MSQPKWQPGPWKVDPDHRPGMAWNRHIVFGDGDGRICFMAHSGGGNPERDKANADLIAAAPDLDAALLALANEVDAILSIAEEAIRAAVGNTNAACLKERVLDARAALAKARGEQ